MFEFSTPSVQRISKIISPSHFGRTVILFTKTYHNTFINNWTHSVEKFPRCQYCAQCNVRSSEAEKLAATSFELTPSPIRPHVSFGYLVRGCAPVLWESAEFLLRLLLRVSLPVQQASRLQSAAREQATACSQICRGSVAHGGPLFVSTTVAVHGTAVACKKCCLYPARSQVLRPSLAVIPTKLLGSSSYSLWALAGAHRHRPPHAHCLNFGANIDGAEPSGARGCDPPELLATVECGCGR